MSSSFMSLEESVKADKRVSAKLQTVAIWLAVAACLVAVVLMGRLPLH